jgi:hypothetical protein
MRKIICSIFGHKFISNKIKYYDIYKSFVECTYECPRCKKEFIIPIAPIQMINKDRVIDKMEGNW